MKTQEELQEELTALKLKYEEVYTIEVPLNRDKSKVATIFLKDYDRPTYCAVNKAVGGTDPLIATEIFLGGTYIGGDELDLITKNVRALVACDTTLYELMKPYQAVIKKN